MILGHAVVARADDKEIRCWRSKNLISVCIHQEHSPHLLIEPSRIMPRIRAMLPIDATEISIQVDVKVLRS